MCAACTLGTNVFFLLFFCARKRSFPVKVASPVSPRITSIVGCWLARCGLWDCLQVNDRAGGQGEREGFREKDPKWSLSRPTRRAASPLLSRVLVTVGHVSPALVVEELQKTFTVTGVRLKI